ncbi:MAG TPA: hypothetical protein VLX28_23325 [Thermoanaerobaculia bacterium]|nr:hypothetical protein [Thermoanaerobaculia bacterium]
MRKAVTFAKRTSRWEILSVNVTPYLEEMPFLQPLVAELDVAIAEAKALDAEQEEANSRLKDIIHRRQALEERGESLRRRASAHLRGIFGFTSPELLKFGVQLIKVPVPRADRPKKKI